VRPELFERDPSNRLLATGPRHRLSAEVIRDQALAASGLLNRKMYGPPVHPPLPEGVWNPFQAADKWQTAEVGDGDRYRRSIYTYTKRTIPYPMFAAFDAPSREVCTPRRLRSNTPLQALMTLNDATFQECARALAARMRAEASMSPEEQLAYGYRLVTGTACNDTRRAELVRLWHDATAQVRGGAGGNVDGGTPEEAAMIVVASVLLNLDEVLMK
jgi:hypothetical protein